MEIKRCSSLWKCRDDSDNILTEVDGQFTQLGLSRPWAFGHIQAAMCQILAVQVRESTSGSLPIQRTRTQYPLLVFVALIIQWQFTDDTVEKSNLTPHTEILTVSHGFVPLVKLCNF